jgi:hypothetical protein
VPVDASHDLYGLPLDQFIPERAALVKALRAEKQRDEAGEVAALRKPSVAAWAVNQLVRTQTSAIRALFQAGDRLVQAQADAAAGKRAGDAMRDATRAQRDAVDRLVNAAEGLLSSDGHPLSQTTLERVGDTLRAAAVDEEARRQVEEGCLTHELRFVGLGVGDALTSAAPTRPAAKPKAPEPRKEPKQPKASKAGKATRAKADAPADADADADAAKREAEAAAAAQAEAERERKAALKAARQAETDARRAATRAEKELAAAQAKRDEAADALAQAEQRLTDAEHKAEQAAGELENAERAVHEVSA